MELKENDIKVKVVCAIIVDEKGRVLLTKRARDPDMGKWALLSGIGASRKGLREVEAIVDEVKTDLGVVFSGELLFENKIENSETTNGVQVYVGEIDGDLVLNPEAATDSDWLTLENALEFDLAFDHKEILTKYGELSKKI